MLPGKTVRSVLLPGSETEREATSVGNTDAASECTFEIRRDLSRRPLFPFDMGTPSKESSAGCTVPQKGLHSGTHAHAHYPRIAGQDGGFSSPGPKQEGRERVELNWDKGADVKAYLAHSLPCPCRAQNRQVQLPGQDSAGIAHGPRESCVSDLD